MKLTDVRQSSGEFSVEGKGVGQDGPNSVGPPTRKAHSKKANSILTTGVL